jgi:hypothetical protein
VLCSRRWAESESDGVREGGEIVTDYLNDKSRTKLKLAEIAQALVYDQSGFSPRRLLQATKTCPRNDTIFRVHI